MALGIAVAKLVYRLIKSCLWEILRKAMGGCFPADATVQLSSGSIVPMLKLKIGDKVLASDGWYSEVYVMSHQDPTSIMEFVQLKLQNHTIEATAGHFLPVSRSCDHLVEDTRASDVTQGMCLFVLTAGQMKEMQPVLSKQHVIKQGVYNPFTMHGTIAVNGVVASSHSDWFLDGLAEYFGRTHLLPTVYQAVLAPARGLYRLVGAEAARAILEDYKVDMAYASENNLVLKPYLDLLLRAAKRLTYGP
jgi:hypothetical protein